MVGLVEKEYLDLIIQIEQDIVTLDALQEELQYFHARAIELNVPHEEKSDREDDFEFALSQYHGCKDELLEKMEEWFDHTKRLGMPVDINYYRILRQLRKLEEEGY